MEATPRSLTGSIRWAGPSDHFQRLESYYLTSRLSFDWFVGGAKHFGYHPRSSSVAEHAARVAMEIKIVEVLGLDESMRVLDAGCGQGRVATHLAKRCRCHIDGVTVVAFEIPKAVALSRKMGVSDRTRFHLVDYSDTSFPDSYFDAAYFMETLCHAADLARTLSELRRILKPGGRVAFFEYTVSELSDFDPQDRSQLDWITRETAMPSLEKFVPERLVTNLEDAGFLNANARDLTRNFLPSLAHYWRMGVVPYRIIRTLGLRRLFPNVSSIVMAHQLAQRGLLGYHLFTATT